MDILRSLNDHNIHLFIDEEAAQLTREASILTHYHLLPTHNDRCRPVTRQALPIETSFSSIRKLAASFL